jgi:hypothetical protein
MQQSKVWGKGEAKKHQVHQFESSFEIMHQKRLQADISGYCKIFMQAKGCLDSYGFVNEREKEGFKILN